MADTFIPYVILWYLMIRSIQLGYPYAVTLMLAVPAAGLLVRIFILFHDCVHSSFFASSRANTVLGYVCGTLVFTPLEDWRFTHLRHHATFANLDARGVGDVTTLTVTEYVNSPWAKRLRYRLYRNPLVLFGVGPLFYFLVRQRWPSRAVSKKARRSVHITTLAVIGTALAVTLTIGLKTYLLIQLPVLWLAGVGGVWLFYVQHQFEGVYWARREAWDPLRAALGGCSFYKLPEILRWFSGSIGLHFIHHLRSRIPNYNLKPCYDAVPELQAKEPLALRKSLSSSKLKLWAEELRTLVGFPVLESSAS
jgi:omega-6 fatty acid desaturase (delta-12 desaturase)